MPTGPLIILLAASVAVCGVLTVLVIGRKGARDRREARFAYRRRRYLDTVLRGSPAHLRAIAAEACGDTTAQVDLAIAIDQSGSGLGRVRQERLADATAAAALTDTLRRELRSRRAGGILGRGERPEAATAILEALAGHRRIGGSIDAVRSRVVYL